MKSFDRRFGKELHRSLPPAPGIYRFYDEAGELIYVGKAKNLRRRLAQYRNAKRCKAHLKMRQIVREAHRLEHEVCESEFAALTLENQIIQARRPKWNVEGAFYFLYPMVGVRFDGGNLALCYTTQPPLCPGFRFHGAFRSRRRTKEGFFALIELLRTIGHEVPRAQLVKTGIAPPILRRREGFVYGFRRIPAEWQAGLESFLGGEDFSPIEELSLLLLERPAALARGKEIQDHLYAIRRFWRHELRWLKKAREHCAWPEYPVAQRDRDLLFIAMRTKQSLVKAPATMEISPSPYPDPESCSSGSPRSESTPPAEVLA